MKNKIIETISKVTGLDKKLLDSNFSNQGLWDSFQLVEIIVALEEEFNIAYSQEDMIKFTSVENITSITGNYTQWI